MMFAAAMTAAAQQTDNHDTTRPLPAWEGPPAPIPPNVINHDEKGRATLRAVRIDQLMHVDGFLDYERYSAAPRAGGFVQELPREGIPAVERTEICILSDDKNLYFSAHCFDSHPEREVVNELRRDNTQGIN